MKHYDYLIVGAGLFASVFACKAREQGKSCLVIDKREHIGGNIYTQNIDGINLHKYGAHIFHTDSEEVWQFVNRFAEFNDFVNTPIANYKGELYNLPFNMNTFEQMWGVKTAQEAQQKINEQKSVIKGEPKNLEQQAISLVGTDIYEKLVKGYTEKQWGRECSELPAFIIKRLPVRFVYDNNYFNDRYQGIPIGGYTKMIEKMLDGCDVILETDYFDQKQKWDSMADCVLYTGCIDLYYDYCFGKLEYRSLRFENELLDKEYFQPVAVVNYTDEETKFTRIIEHKHFEKTDCPKTIITREYPADWTEGMDPYYPVNNEENQAVYQKYAALAEKESKVIFGGRLGGYKYYDMDDTVLAALELAKKEFQSGH
ncbi:MAG: UDP-galactopyranose mutase [Ruminococcaceae bacterium]|nr:UDP-galactopyranose mutase [Oscillospiraceae bacterium]